MPSVLLVHADSEARARLVEALSTRGVDVAGVADVDAALEAADAGGVGAVLVDVPVLEHEDFEIKSRIDVRSGNDVRVIALASIADPARKAVLKRHGAILLERPPEDIDSMAAMVTRGTPARRPAPSGLGRMKVERLATGDDDPLDAPVGPDGAKPLVLVVDDEEDARSLFTDVLQGRGYRVHAVSSANGALRFLGKEKVDLIVSDIAMPQMDGFELKATLAESDAKNVPFIAVAAEDTAERRAIAQRLGIRAFVPKPIQARAFCKLVRGTLLTDAPV